MMTFALLALSLGQRPHPSLPPVEPPTCHQSGSARACGYHCRAEFGQVECAQTPEGFCTRIEGKLGCWDPPQEVRLHPVSFAKPGCRAKLGQIACGYECATTETHIACAQTPYGLCATRFNEVVCWDPDPALIHYYSIRSSSGELLRGASCVQSDSGFACGFNCKKSYGAMQCAQTPAGICSVLDGHITCFDPPLPSASLR